nr:two-component regulator propeller domain-containing protein [Pedobacter sp. ASV2]
MGLHNCLQAQFYVKRNTFTTNEGLPSNHIYDIVEDNKGFLWIATDNGVSRFDGKYFQNFGVKNGLPSNDVLQIFKDGDGNVWANSYKQLPAYFDEINGSFVTIKGNPCLNAISKTLLGSTDLIDGSIKFYNQMGYVIFKNKKITDYQYKSKVNDKLIINGKQIELRYQSGVINNAAYNKNYIYSKNKLLDSIVIKSNYNFTRRYVYHNDIFQFTVKNRIYKTSNIRLSPFSYQVDSVTTPENVAWFKFSDQSMTLVSPKGNVYVYTKKNFTPISQLKNNINANCAYVDKFKNIWVGTLDGGLTYYGKNITRNISLPPNYIKPNFLSITIDNKNQIFAGNYYGQVLTINNNHLNKYENHKRESPAWVRKIISIGNKTVVVNDMGYSINFKPDEDIFTADNKIVLLKTAVAVNDSVVVFGTITGLLALNLNTGKTKKLNSDNDRALALVMANDKFIYYIGTKGLFKYDLTNNTSAFIPLSSSFKNENLSVLTFAKDNTLWASSLSGNLLVFKNDKIVATIKGNASLPENITCMQAFQNKIWIGGKKGIAVLDYKFYGNKFNYSINNISKTDGLLSNTINDLAIKNDSIYVATENGISIIPANYQNPRFEISPALTNVKINQINTPIAQNYILESNQNNITLQFAGIEISGHFKAIQYSLDGQKNWNSLEGNILNIQLNSGSHTIFIRAIDVNNQISKQTLKINFFIKTPFYKALWFWLFIAILITGAIFWWVNRRKLLKQRTIFEQQLALELQRKKITADLHDDIGATLSSLQLNSAVANQMINTDIKQAKKILNKIEDQSKNLADKIGDIIWSMKPGKDEFMTISSRIKNFANDILSATNINYKILIDPEVNKRIQDITTRKNIVLITKEAINNVVKYSNSSEVLISLKIKDNQASLIIQDDGIGFNPCEKRGNGLANMRKRTEELNGTFAITSAIKSGTSISVIIPLVP